jgi:hypothetical protein
LAILSGMSTVLAPIGMPVVGLSIEILTTVVAIQIAVQAGSSRRDHHACQPSNPPDSGCRHTPRATAPVVIIVASWAFILVLAISGAPLIAAVVASVAGGMAYGLLKSRVHS